MDTKKKIIALGEWAKKNGISDRHARRLVAEGKIPMKKYPTFILGVESDFKLKK